jgi:hypothetical protein
LEELGGAAYWLKFNLNSYNPLYYKVFLKFFH